MRRLVGLQFKRDRAVISTGVVVRGHDNLAGLGGVVDNPHEALAARTIACRRKQRHRDRAAAAARRRRGQIREVARWTLQQAHDENGRHRIDDAFDRRLDDQLPFSGALAKCALKPFAAGLQILDRNRPRREAPQRHPHALRWEALVVDARDGDLDRSPIRVEQAQQARLHLVPTRIESGHSVVPVFFAFHHIVHRRQEAVLGTDVGEHFEIQSAPQQQAPAILVDVDVRPNRLGIGVRAKVDRCTIQFVYPFFRTLRNPALLLDLDRCVLHGGGERLPARLEGFGTAIPTQPNALKLLPFPNQKRIAGGFQGRPEEREGGGRMA